MCGLLRLLGCYTSTFSSAFPLLPPLHSEHRAGSATVAPHSGSHKQGMTADHLQVLDGSFAADDCAQHDLTLRAGLNCQWRIRRLQTMNEVALHPMRDGRMMHRSRWYQNNVCIARRA